MANPNFKENKVKRTLAKTLQPLVKILSKKLYISLQYHYITGHRLDWKHLSRYTEKLQFLRLYVYPKSPRVSLAAGRVGARQIVSDLKLEHILIPSYGVYNKFSEIDFDKLPTQFVLKTTHGSGMNYICLDKSKVDFPSLKKQFTRYLKMDYGKKTVEPHYSKIKHQLIIEKYIGEGDVLPTEYKIHVFNGVARYLYVVTNRGKDIRYSNFYIDWRPFNGAQFNHWQTSETPLEPPQNYHEMVKIAEKLASGFPFVRIDLYEVNGHIYFSEFTFTPAKGTLIFDNEKADYEIGSWLDIEKYRQT